jgi:ribosomal protein S18 acetylase RimI-like enzyme
MNIFNLQTILWHSNLPEAIDEFSKVLERDRQHFPLPWSENDWQPVLTQESKYRLFLFFHKVDDQNFQQIGHSLFFCADFQRGLKSPIHLLKICLDPEARKKGFGEVFFQQLESLLTSDFSEVFLEVDSSNIQALKYYEKNGFSAVHRKDHYYSNGASAIFFLKKWSS